MSIHSRMTALPTPCSSLKRTSNSPQRSSVPRPVSSHICCLTAAICPAGDRDRLPSTKANGGSVKPPSGACCERWCLTKRRVSHTRFSGTLMRASKACNSACTSGSCADMASKRLHACATSAGSRPPVRGHGGGCPSACLPFRSKADLLISMLQPIAAATPRAAPSAPLTIKAGIDGACSPKSPIRKGSIASRLLKTTTATAPAFSAAVTA
mmetsp:Transcript_141544/g.394452  ORF Transcript_141544/g.394452 Transcript_141544/m.394452 type:complete len:211 (+) Transcript_141544:1183-1815(+)